MGAAFSRTKDGGKTWEKVLYQNDLTGAIDPVMSPGDPDVLFAALWTFERKAWGSLFGGPDGGIWRSSTRVWCRTLPRRPDSPLAT